MKHTNSAVSLLKCIGGSAALMGESIDAGIDYRKHDSVPMNKEAGSKIARQIKRENVGLTCHFGNAINRKA
jgi:hypothetical protein